MCCGERSCATVAVLMVLMSTFLHLSYGNEKSDHEYSDGVFCVPKLSLELFDGPIAHGSSIRTAGRGSQRMVDPFG